MDTIKILGAGPSGLCAAINLAKEGYKVEVYEKNKDVGLRFKGDLQGLENWSKKTDIEGFLRLINIDINFDFDPFSDIELSDGKNEWKIHLKRPAFYLVKRGNVKGSLDKGLKKQAKDLGIKIHFKKTINKEDADIIATGPDFKKIFGMDKGIRFKTDLKDIAVGLLNDTDAFKGYSYLLVTKGYGCMCTCLAHEYQKINDCFEETRKAFSNLIDFKIKEPKQVGGIGSFALKSAFSKGRSRIVGEAAGLQDLLWGFGIRSALFSGYLAARSIVENKDYDELAKHYFEKRLKASIVNRYLWERFGKNNYHKIIEKMYIAKDPIKLLHSFYNYNLIQRIIFPVAKRYCKKRYGNLEI